MRKSEIAAKAVQVLKNKYPEAVCSLNAKNALELLIATRLSAQCTDARVNMVTPALFERFKNCNDFADADITEVEGYIKSCGLYKTKAESIVLMCRMIRDEFNGEVPDTLDKLVLLPGIGRKTANLIMGDVYGQPAIVTDTHLIRISNRLGLVNTKDAYKVEIELKKIIDPYESNNFCHRVVLFGREVCTARNPKCAQCELNFLCSHYKKVLKGM